ncbi:hypothetical protein AHiyo8_32330 [Arthrobacter sp. Hiyo8]|nr:hypothetical protein AHiyo8_32330 [Arthrobacter sp. Hiyo8]
MAEKEGTKVGTYTATVARPGRQFGPITAKTESGVRLGV